MLEIGKNTYIDVAGADWYISTVYAGNQQVTDFWDNLTGDAKEKYLQLAMEIMESQKWTGHRKFTLQETEFPRVNRETSQIGGSFTGDINPTWGDAQVEILVGIIDIPSNAGRSARLVRQREGVVSFSLDGFSETYDKSMRGEELESISKRAYMLLRRWLSGSYSAV